MIKNEHTIEDDDNEEQPSLANYFVKKFAQIDAMTPKERKAHAQFLEWCSKLIPGEPPKPELWN